MDLVILGGGPAALETASAHYLHLSQQPTPFTITILEQHAQLCGGILETWPDVKMFSTMNYNVTPHSLKLIPDFEVDATHAPTGKEYVAGYCTSLLTALLQVPTITIKYKVTVNAVTRILPSCSKSTLTPSRANSKFRILVNDNQYIIATHVIDCTGVKYTTPLGPGGIPALGERGFFASRPSVVSTVIARPGESVAGNVVVVGSGYSAATTLTNLLDLSPPPSITWLTRKPAPVYDVLDSDVLPLRKELCVATNGFVADDKVSHVSCAVIVEVKDGVLVLEDGKEVPYDRIYNHTGGRPDLGITKELQIHTCYATEGPMKLAASLMGGSGDCMAQVAAGVEALMTSEARFFVVGSKSYGRGGGYLHKIGGAQAEEIAKFNCQA